MRIGIIGPANESGLGRLVEDFYNHFECNVLAVNHNKGQRRKFERALYSQNATPTNDELHYLADESDLLLTFETPFSPNAYKIFKQRKKPTVCMTMYECMQDGREFWNDVDVFISCSLPDLQTVGYRNKIFLPVPIDTERIKFIPRQGKIRKIIHNAGYGGFYGRNGTTEVLKTFSRYQGDDMELIIRGQQKPELDAMRDKKNIIFDTGEKEFDQLYSYGDLFFFPCRFNGLSLPIQESMAAGLPVLTSPLKAWKGLVPEEWQVPFKSTMNIAYGRMIEIGMIDPEKAVAKIEWLKTQDLQQLSYQARAAAEKRSWAKLKPEYEKLFNVLCKR